VKMPTDGYPSALKYKMSDLVAVKRALISVSDKSGLEQFAAALHNEFGVELISTGGTAAHLRAAGLAVTDVSQVTGFPEMMDGRLKTLHPKIHGGLLAVRDDARHAADMRAHGIAPIDLVCVNLYPFEKTVAKPGATFEEAIENIDIGGPAMIRSAAKNHRYVLVVTGPDRYEKVLGDLRKHQGASCGEHRRRQAQRAFAYTAEYDRHIAEYLLSDRAVLPETLALYLTRRQELRYGENPHQKGALYVDRRPSEASAAFAVRHHGKELSYINLLDADAALGLVSEFAEPAACIVKHATPCGCAMGSDPAEAFRRAYEGDAVAAFGGIAALNRPVDAAAAAAIAAVDKLMEVIVAPEYSKEALQVLSARWKNARILEVGAMGGRDERELQMHKIVGGFLVQQRDIGQEDEESWRAVSARQPTAREMDDLRFAWRVCKHVKSNAIAVCKEGMLVGAGAGQMDRPSAARLAIGKAGERAKGAVAASDAFFPFPDGPRLLLEAGVTAIIQPGGSMQDQLTIEAVNAAGAAMVFTGRRHFKH
jgi:phosphoribosylaminoimidazolecarboxamide formyltransferase / IMP cyclohydrolase